MNILTVGKGKEAINLGIRLSEAGYGYTHDPTELLATRTLKEREIDLVILGGDVGNEREIDELAKRLKNAALGGPRGLAPHVFVACNQHRGIIKGKECGFGSVDMLLGEFSVDLCMNAYEQAKESVPC